MKIWRNCHEKSMFSHLFSMLFRHTLATLNKIQTLSDESSSESNEFQQKYSQISSSDSILLIHKMRRPITKVLENIRTQSSATLKQLLQKAYRDWKAFKARHGKLFSNDDDEHRHMLNYLR